jgi:hypothetical protein
VHPGASTLFSEAHGEATTSHVSNLAGVLDPGPTLMGGSAETPISAQGGDQQH